MIALIPTVAFFAVLAATAATHTSRTRRRDRGHVADLRRELRRADHGIRGLRRDLRDTWRVNERLEQDKAALQIIAANHLRRAWRAERALANQSAQRVVAEAEAVVAGAER
jgi:hypothetical protein